MIYAYRNCKRDPLVNPAFYLIFFQLISFVGTVTVLNFSNTIDVTYFFIYVVGVLSYILGLYVGGIIFPVTNSTVSRWKSNPFLVEGASTYTLNIFSFLILSSIVCGLYFYAVGYNVFLLGISELFSQGKITQDISTLRLASYNSQLTGDYFYPGYVNQFKDTLFPLCIFYLWGRQGLFPNNNINNSPKIFLWAFTLISLISILGTGQRGAFVLVLIMGGAFILTILPKKRKKKVVLFGGTIMLSFFMISTFINGRTGSDEFTLTGVLQAIWERIFSDNQWSAAIGFRELIYKSPIQWGGEWLEAFYGLAPGHPGSMLANDIGQFIYGGYGTSPPSNFGSIYYNFGWIGIVIFPFFFSLLMRYLYQRFYKKPKFLFRVLIYISGFVLMGTWLAGNPIEYFFNAGLIAIIFFKYILSTLRKSFPQKWFSYFPQKI